MSADVQGNIDKLRTELPETVAEIERQAQAEALAALQHFAIRRHEFTEWCSGCQSIARLLRVDYA